MRGTQAQAAVFTVAGRYEIKEAPIGHGGMGVVYKAYDTVTRRYVALKTISGVGNSTALNLFEKEWSVLARLSHPNIVDILETGQFEEKGRRKPFFVMPLLPGMTLDRLINSDSHRLTVERTVEIIAQTCRGLQAAHDQGLVHRDIKPSNIFVLDDDSVKIIDFGVVHLAEVRTATGMKGTLQYVAPELLSGKPPSPLSDIFALAVVCYEALTGRKPFARPTEDETAEAIRTHIPPPASDLNSAVNQLVSRTVHKAMAKQPMHRFSGAREFGEILKKALRNEPIEYFDSARIQPRIERVKKAQSEGDYQFAREILTELEAEGHLDPQIPLLRIQLDQAIQQKTIRQLLENARTRIEEEEYPLALQKVQEILEIDPQHAEALHMKAEIEKWRSEKQVDQWYRLVHEHIGNRLFSQARQGLEEILRVRPSDVQAHALLAQVDQQEKESINQRKEREQLYESALNCYHQGEISTALDKLERVLSLARQSPGTESAAKEAQYQTLYKQIRSEREAFRNAYAEARRHLEEKNFSGALALCAEFLKKSPTDPLFQALKLETEERERQELSAAVAEVGRRVEAEADLDRQISILKEAAQKYPKDAHFQDTLKLIRERRDLVNSIVSKAKQYEQRSQFAEALGQWDIVRNIYRRYPGLEVEIERLTKRRDEQAREETKSRWVRLIDQHLEAGECEKAQAALRDALTEFPGDRELGSMEKLVVLGIEKRGQAAQNFDEGRKLCASGDFENGISSLRKAAELDSRNPTIRAALLNSLLDQGRSLLSKDWQLAKPLLEEALQLEEGNPVARSLFAQLQDHERQAEVDSCVCEARDLQAAGDLPGALTKVQALLQRYPNEMRLSQLQTTLVNSLRAEPNRARLTPKVEPPIPKRNRLSSTGADVALESPEVDEAATVVRPREAEMAAAAGMALESSAPASTAEPRAARSWKWPAVKPWYWVCVGLIPLIAVAILEAMHLAHRQRLPVPSAVSVPLQLHANVDGATFKLDGHALSSTTVSVVAGKEYVIEASLPGYKTEIKRITASGLAPGQIEFALSAIPPKLTFSSDLARGQISLGEDQPVPLQSGEFSSEELASGSTTLKVWDRKRLMLELPLIIQPGQAVTLSGPIEAKDCSVVVVSTLGNSARLYTSPDLRGSSGSQPAAAIPADGIAMDTGATGSEFNLSDGRSIPIQPADAPSITISLSTGGETGTLQIQANVPDAQVKIDGKTRRNAMANGSKTVLLETGKHQIQVIAPGYADSEVREVEIVKGKSSKEVFALSGLQAQLSMEGVEPGATVYVDGVQSGTTSDSGAFKLDVAPGEHRIGLKKRDYEDSSAVVRDFKPRQVETVSGRQLALLKNGALSFTVTPADATITLRSGNDPPKTVRPNQSIFLKRGTYAWVIEADHFQSISETSTVEPGSFTTLSRTLQPVEAAELSAADVFENPSSWSRHGNWWVLKQLDYGWLKFRTGTFNVIIEKQRAGLWGKRKAEWTLDFRGQGDKVTYTADGHTLIRQVVSGGSASPAVKTQFKERSDIYQFILDVSPSRIVVRDNGNNPIDSVDRSDPSVDVGRIGFRGEISLTVQRLR